jgi:hypothetical protein
MEALIAGAVIWIVARLASAGAGEKRYPCRLCADRGVHWTGEQFVHSNSRKYMPTQGIDDMVHPALPVGFGEG